MKSYKTEQEDFWAGKFGDTYINRNKNNTLLSSNIALFSQILSRTHNINSVIEFGANIGYNLKAIQQLLPNIELFAVEINANAIEEIKKLEKVTVYHQSILDFYPENKVDLALIKGVLIHINPEVLPQVYKLLYDSAKHYICMVEYYSPTPIEINYRGYQERLFKRDFAGEMLDRFQDLHLVDYGFIYHRDNQFPQDDTTWFLLEKITVD